jgi:hypothetical protein
MMESKMIDIAIYSLYNTFHQQGENMLIVLFARKEPTADDVSKQHGFSSRMDTVLYRDKACTEVAARWPWFASNCPDRRFKTVMLNCWKWKLEWLPIGAV